MQSNAIRQFRFGVGLILFIIAFGTFGYEIIEEDMNFLDSLYMSVITISTTGFKEVTPLSPEGRVFTVFLIISGVLAIAYTGGKAAQLFIEKQFFRRKRMFRRLETLGNHYIVCGYGRMGVQVCESLNETHHPFVIIESDPLKIEKISEKNYLFVEGDATNDEILLAAGLKRAKGLVAVVRTDAENVFTTLSAKELNPKLFVVARAIDEGTESKLRKAGADRVVKPYELGGNRMVQLLIRPGVIDFIDGVARNEDLSISLEELPLGEKSSLIGKSLVDAMKREEINIIIVAISRKNGKFIYNPKSLTVFEKGDKLIAIGERDDLEKLTILCNQ